ncbi:Bor family protein [Leptospira mayottensis]|uniref:Bor family protein n=1 Tax=Leptospira mayottensis TaxID=1137606 RepID=UPI0020B1290E|nr:Bor family protein [Leptospira mayottensis]
MEKVTQILNFKKGFQTIKNQINRLSIGSKSYSEAILQFQIVSKIQVKNIIFFVYTVFSKIKRYLSENTGSGCLLQKALKKNGKLIIVMFLLTVFWNCQHARVRFPQETPEPCKLSNQKKECKIALEARIKMESTPKQTFTISQNFYFWGLKPSNYAIDGTAYCPHGVYEAYQFTSFWNGLYEQLTLGFFSPRTLVLTCHSS